ncbi:MAG: transcription-repair coupling factor, partial [Gammaproteobacteria bacterium]|nr:transcription-repair coupling factor [Gammaproteobacteria bacterium]
IAEAAQTSNTPLLVLVDNTDTALHLKAELQFFLTATDQQVHMLPDWEILPYDSFSAHPDIVSERIKTLNAIGTIKQGIILVPIATLLHRLAPTHYLAATSFALQTGQDLALQTFRQRLDQAGYQYTETVFQAGEYAVRGSLIDLYAMGSHAPLRIELFDEQIESLRHFDPDSQRTTDIIQEFHLLPAREFPLTEQAISQFRQAFNANFDVESNSCPVYQDISQGLVPAGIEYYIPLFYDLQMATLLDYLPKQINIIRLGDLNTAIEHFWQDVTQRYDDYSHDVERPLLSPKHLFLSAEQLFKLLKQQPNIHLQAAAFNSPQAKQGEVNLGFSKLPEVAINSKLAQPLMALESLLQTRTR